MFCRYCGKQILDDSKYCEFCGKQLVDSVDEEISINVEEPEVIEESEVVERCRVCGKIFCNEPRISLETGGKICEACDAAFREAGSEDKDESGFEMDTDILEVINNKENYTYEELKGILLWLKENECTDEANDLEGYIKKQEVINQTKAINHTDKYIDKRQSQTDISINKESERADKTVKKEERCIICGEIFYDEHQNLSETSDLMCERCSSVFQKMKVTNETEAELNIANHNRDVLPKQIDCIDIVDLKEYLDIVINMEKNIYLQNSLISQMKSRSEQLGHPHIYQKPIEPNSNGGTRTVVSGILTFIGFFLLCWGLQLCSADSEGFLLGLIVLCFGGVLFLYGVIMSIDMIKKDDSFLNEKDKYDVEYAEYERNISADKERIRKEQLEKAVLFSEIQLLQKQNKDSKQNLEKIYSQNIIFPKYRNLTMACSIYEYICAGRCTTLEGHEGAYNILEMEIRLDRIITQLDLVITQLDAIRNNQYMLYSIIQETNQQVSQILESTNYVMDNLQDFYGQAEELVKRIASVEKNSELASYQAENLQKELHYMNRMNYLSGKYNNVFYNLPPS